MKRTENEMNSVRMQRVIAAAGVVLILAAALMAIGLNAGSATAAWDSPSSGSKAAKKKNQVTETVAITGTVTVTGTVTETPLSTATSAVTRTATRTPNVAQTRTPRPTGTVSKVAVCHRTGSQTNPYVLITISINALPAHQGHGDIYPAPQGGCPQGTPRATRTVRATNTARPTTTATVQANKGNGNANPGNNGNNGNNGNANPGANGNNGNGKDNGNGGKKDKP